MTFRYNKTSDKPILDDVNLSIRSGETIGVIGGTGSSKSSLVNLISRLYDVSEGAVLVGGKDVRSYDLDTLRDEGFRGTAEQRALLGNHLRKSALG